MTPASRLCLEWGITIGGLIPAQKEGYLLPHLFPDVDLQIDFIFSGYRQITPALLNPVSFD
jgi:hypothetical protein